MSEKFRKKAHSPLQKVTPPNTGKDKKSIIAGVLAAVLLLTIITYSNSINNDFVSNRDDDEYVVENVDIRDLTFSKALNFFKLDSTYSDNYHPLTMLSYALEAKAFGVASARPFHLTNLILHLVNVCLVFYLIYAITAKLNAAAIVAVFFAVHPMHVESVAWISERKDVLYTLFYLGSALCYLKYLRSRTGSRWLVYSMVLFVLSCLSKSMAVTLPVILLLIDYFHSRRDWRASVTEKIPYFIIALFFGYMAVRSQSHAMVTGMALQIGYVDRIFIVFYNLMYYLVMLFCPVSLSAIHYYPEKTGGALPLIYYLAPAGILLIGLGVYKAKKFRRELIFGLLFYLVAILPVIQIIPIGASMVSERYSYVPYIGLLFILGVAFSGLAEKQFGFDTRRLYLAGKIILVAYVALFAVMSFQQNKVWKNGITLFTQIIERYPDRSHPYISRGVAKMKANDLNGALDDYSLAIRYDAGNAEAYSNRASVQNLLQQYDLALRDCQEAIRLKADLADAYNNCGIALAEKGNYEDSLTYFIKAIEKDPGHYIALNNVVRARCVLFNCEGAMAYSDKAIKINPYYADAYFSRGNIRQALNDTRDAIDNYTKAIELDPVKSKAYRNRGVSYLQMNNYLKAAEDLRKAISLDPGNPDDFYDLGVAYYYLSLFEEACEIWNSAAVSGQPDAQAAMAQYCR